MSLLLRRRALLAAAAGTPPAPAGDIEFVGATTASYVDANVSSFDVPVPAGVQADDLMVMVTTQPSDRNVAVPSGWTERLNITGTAIRLVVWTRTAGASEPAQYTVSTISSTTAAIFGMVVYRNAVYHAIESADDSFNTVATFPSANVGSVPAVLFRVLGVGSLETDSTVSSPPDGVERVLVEVPSSAGISAAKGTILGIWSKEIESTGASGTDTATIQPDGDRLATATVVIVNA